MATVDIKGLSKVYGNTTVLDELDIEVRDGEFLTLLGPSGCGKTTTLRCVAGLERADGGSISIGGEVVASAADNIFVPPNRRSIGMVFQSYALWPHMSVFANVAYPLRMRRSPGVDIRARVNEILQTVGMADFVQRQVTELSGGQQQRVALARAMVGRPQLLLFDEPLSNLDAKLRQTMRREIRAAHDATGGTSIYVTHDQQEAVTLSDRVIVLRHGVVQQIGTPREIYRVPVNSFVADFVGFDNLLTGTIAQRKSDGCAVAIGGTDLSVWAELGPGAAPGASVALAVRAEDLNIEAGSAGESGRVNDGDGVVRSCTYTGQHIEYVVDVGQQALLVRVDEQAQDHDAFARGDRVSVRFNRARSVVVPIEPDSAQTASAPVASSETVLALEKVR
jgi:iron(III) transport system ATP-binding protein